MLHSFCGWRAQNRRRKDEARKCWTIKCWLQLVHIKILVAICCYFSSQTRFSPICERAAAFNIREIGLNDNEVLQLMMLFRSFQAKAEASQMYVAREREMLQIDVLCPSRQWQIPFSSITRSHSPPNFEVEYIYDLNNINLSIKHMDLFQLSTVPAAYAAIYFFLIFPPIRPGLAANVFFLSI